MKNAKKGAYKPCANRPQNILQMTNMNVLLLSMFLYIYVCVIFPVTAGSFTYVLYMCILNFLYCWHFAHGTKLWWCSTNKKHIGGRVNVWKARKQGIHSCICVCCGEWNVCRWLCALHRYVLMCPAVCCYTTKVVHFKKDAIQATSIWSISVCHYQSVNLQSRHNSEVGCGSTSPQNPCSYTYSCIHIPLPLIFGSTNPQRPQNTKKLISYTILSVPLPLVER